MKNKNRFFILLTLLAFEVIHAQDSADSDNPDIQAVFEDGHHGCMIKTLQYFANNTSNLEQYLWFSARSVMVGTITIQNKSKSQIRLENSSNSGNYSYLQPNQQKTYKFNDYEYTIKFRKQDSMGTWSIAPTPDTNPLGDWIWIKHCSTNSAQFLGQSPATEGSNELGTY